MSLFSSKSFSPSLLGSLSLLTVSPHHMLLVLGMTLITAIKVTKRRLPGFDCLSIISMHEDNLDYIDGDRNLVLTHNEVNRCV